MLTWLKSLITCPNPETLEAQNQRKKQRCASRNHSRQVRAHKRELRRQAQGSRLNAPFHLRKGGRNAAGLLRRAQRGRSLTGTLMILGWTELRYSAILCEMGH